MSAVIPFGKVFNARLRAIGDSTKAGITPEVLATVQYNVRCWQLLLSRFNGVATFAPLPSDTAPLHITTDAAAAGPAGVRCARNANGGLTVDGRSASSMSMVSHSVRQRRLC